MKLLALFVALLFSACSARAAGTAAESTVARPFTQASPEAGFNRTQVVLSTAPREQPGKTSAARVAGVLASAANTPNIAQSEGQEAPAYALWALGLGLIGFKMRRRARA